MMGLKRRNIWVQASFYVLLPLLMLLLAGTSLATYLDYQRSISVQTAEFSKDNALIAATLESRLWELDTEIIESKIDSLVAVSSYSRISVRDSSGYHYEIGAQQSSQFLLTERIDMTASEAFGGQQFGSFEFERDISHLRADAAKKLGTTLLVGLIATFSVGGLILLLIGRVVFRPLLLISEKFRMAGGKLNDVVIQSEGLIPEIASMVDAFLGMRALARHESDAAQYAREMLDNAAEITGLGYCRIDLDKPENTAADARFLRLHDADEQGNLPKDILDPILKHCKDLAKMRSRSGAFDPYSEIVEHNTRDGTAIHLSRTYQLRFNEPSGAVVADVIALNITQVHELEEKLRQSQKMEVVGNLTGGVAHDFNNLLAVTLGNLELLYEDLEDPTSRKMLKTALDATTRGADLTRKMLAFARKAPLKPTVLDLNDVVLNSTNWVGRTFSENIDIETSLLAGLWRVKTDEASAASALLNLLVNARDAMPEGGKITIETANVRIDDDYVSQRDEEIEPGRYAMIAVSDTGSGIARENLSKIFDPFFTTKAPGSGTGLGLSMVLGFLKQSNGTVRVYSELGVGTTFKLYFPVHKDGARVLSKGNAKRAAQSTEGTRILIAEDEPGVLESLEQILTRSGYQVTTASTGDMAAQLFEQDPSFDALLTDIVMPGELQGTTLAKALRKIRPDLPIVFMTGYASEATVHGNGLRVEDIRLMKPVMRADLLAAIETSLSRGAPSEQPPIDPTEL